MAKLSRNAAIAQSVERILGKDEVASSNLASSSKTLKLLEFRGFFLFLCRKSDRILFSDFTERMGSKNAFKKPIYEQVLLF